MYGQFYKYCGPEGVMTDSLTSEINYNVTLPFLKPPRPSRDGKSKPGPSTWTMRKMGISQRKADIVLIQPSEAFLRQLELSWALKDDRAYDVIWVHLMAFEAAHEDTTPYLNSLEEKLHDIVGAIYLYEDLYVYTDDMYSTAIKNTVMEPWAHRGACRASSN